jgi:hypothetical protein
MKQKVKFLCDYRGIEAGAVMELPLYPDADDLEAQHVVEFVFDAPVEVKPVKAVKAKAKKGKGKK